MRFSVFPAYIFSWFCHDFVTPFSTVVHRQRRYGDAARARRRESLVIKGTKYEKVAKEHIEAPMVTKPTLPDGMCLPTGYQPAKGVSIST